MSAHPPKADIREPGLHVRYVPRPDIYAHCRRDGSCNGKWTNGNRVALAGRQLNYHTTRLLTPLAQLGAMFPWSKHEIHKDR